MSFSKNKTHFISKLLLLSFCIQTITAIPTPPTPPSPIPSMPQESPFATTLHETLHANKPLLIYFLPEQLCTSQNMSVIDAVQLDSLKGCNVLIIGAASALKDGKIVTELKPLPLVDALKLSEVKDLLKSGNKVFTFDSKDVLIFSKSENLSEMKQLLPENLAHKITPEMMDDAQKMLNGIQEKLPSPESSTSSTSTIKNCLSVAQHWASGHKKQIFVGTCAVVSIAASGVVVYKLYKKYRPTKKQSLKSRPSLDSLFNPTLNQTVVEKAFSPTDALPTLGFRTALPISQNDFVALKTGDQAYPEYENDPYYYLRQNPDVECIDSKLLRDPKLDPDCIITMEHLFYDEESSNYLQKSVSKNDKSTFFEQLYYPSAIKKVPLEDSIAGEIPLPILALVQRLQSNQKYSGTLTLKGPSGTGKTHMAASIASATGRAFLPIHTTTLGSKWANSYVDDIRKAFEKAYELQRQMPVVIFFDEIDGLGFSRDTETTDNDGNTKTISASPEHLRATLTLTEQIDHCLSRYPKILIIAATNRFNMLDQALKRRLETNGTIIELALPNKENREAILDFYASEQRYAYPSKCFGKIAQLTEGFSCDHMKNIVQQALMLAYQEAEQKGLPVDIQENHFMQAYECIKNNRQHGVKERSWKSKISLAMTAVGLGIQLYSTYSNNINHAASSAQQALFQRQNLSLGIANLLVQQNYQARAEKRQDQAELRQQAFQRDSQAQNHALQVKESWWPKTASMLTVASMGFSILCFLKKNSPQFISKMIDSTNIADVIQATSNAY